MDADATTRLTALGTATLFEADPGRVVVLNGSIKPVERGARVAGPAYCVAAATGDNLAIHRALEGADGGSVLVVATNADTDHGFFGEVMMEAARARDIAGLVIDGGVRDTSAFREQGFPVFAGGVAIRGTVKRDPGHLGGDVTVAGALIRHGSWIVGDDDGLVVLPVDGLEEIIDLAEARAARETALIERIRAGETTMQALNLRSAVAESDGGGAMSARDGKEPASPARWGIAGFGEVGATVATQLIMGAPVSVSDPRLNGNLHGSALAVRAGELGVQVAPDTTALARGCDILLSTVTPTAAREVAEAAAGIDGLILVDFNSVSPGEKQALALLFDDGHYVDGAILGSIAAEGAQVPIALSGARAEEVCLRMVAAGFRVTVTGPDVGAASALKMCRSVFMKGVECLFIETVLAAERFGITEAVLESAEQTFTSLGFQNTVRMLLTTHAVHCGRRADEMAKVTEMLRGLCLPAVMSGASHEMLRSSAHSGLPELVGADVPAEPSVVTDYLTEFYRRRCE